MKDRIEKQVEERTDELPKVNERLQAEIEHRRQAEAKLRQVSEEWEVTFNSLRDPISIHDKDFRLVRVNKAFSEAFQKGPDALLGQHCYRIIHGTEEPWPTCPHRTTLLKCVSAEEEFFESGMGRYLDVSTSPILDPQGEMVGSVHIVKDITDRKKAEVALRESERKYKELTEFLPQPVFEVDERGHIRFVNRKTFETFGGTPEDVEKGLNVLEMVAPEDRDRARENLKTAVTERRSGTDEYRLQRMDGSTFHALITYSPIVEGDQSRGLRGTIVDITDRKNAEEAVRRSEGAARRLARENEIMAEIGRIISSTLNIDDVYGRFAEEVRKLISVDRVAISMVNLEKGLVTVRYTSGATLVGRQLGDTFPVTGTLTEHVVKTRTSLWVQKEDMDELLRRFSGYSKDFQPVARSMIIVPLFSKDQIIGAMYLQSTTPDAYTAVDLRLAESIANQIAGAMANAELFTAQQQSETEKTAIEEQFRQAQKMEAVGRLAGGVAHDFNNLLTVIIGNCQLSLFHLKAGDPLKGNVEEIHKAAERAAVLTRQLLAFSRRQILEVKVLDLNSILQDLEKMLHRVIGEDIELVTFLEKDLGKVRSDPGQIEQLIVNLVVNARDAMPRGGKLVIETANVELDDEYARAHISVKPGHYVRLSLSDTGVGMTQETRDRIFEPFFTTKEKGKGTGLGLSTVYGIVKQSKGNIWVYSEPDHGTTFKIYLPRVDGVVDASTERRGERREAPRGREKILLVEDEDAVRKLSVQYLTRQGYHVLEARHGGDALLICKQHKEPIQLMVTDLVMPGMSGRELAETLLGLRPEMKVLYMSGYTENAIAHHGVLDKGPSFLQKPFSLEDLALKVRDVLDSSGDKRER